MNKISTPYIGFAAYSGTGKTTLLSKLIPLLKEKGLRVGVIKHAHHGFDLDVPKKDSYVLRDSGADTLLIASRKRTAIIQEHPTPTQEPEGQEQQEPTLEDTLSAIPKEGLDLILVEGFKHANFPKIELHREALNKPYIYSTDSNIVAIATDHKLDASLEKGLEKDLDASNATNSAIPHFDLNQPHQIADFIYSTFFS